MYNSELKVNTAWTIGINDPTAIIFFQCIDRGIRIIDFYENKGENLEHYAKYVLSKPYVYGSHIADADFITGETSVLEFLKGLGINITVERDISIVPLRRALSEALLKE
jgi:hypothetical protein